MSAIPLPSEEEHYLLAIFDDPSGIELAEFTWVDEEQEDGCFRAWDFQWHWYRNEDTYQIDYAGRSLGKSLGIQMRAYAFPFSHPGQEMLITAPELNHLRPVTDKVEHQILSHRLSKEMLPKQRGNGINHQPQFQAHFINNARIMSRLPQRDGKGVKGSVGEGAIVPTTRGLVPIEMVRAGDYVLTHRGRYARVAHVYSYEAERVCLGGSGHRGIVVSENHRVLGESRWEMATDVPIWGICTEYPMLDLPDLPAGAEDGVALLALAGRWVADGNLGVRGDRAVHAAITVKDSEAEIVRLLFKAAGYEPTEREHDGSARCLVVHRTALAMWLRSHFGHRAEGKTIPTWLLGAPLAARTAFLGGYLSGDGHWNPTKRRWEVGTASKALAHGIQALALTQGLQASYSWVDPKVTEVMGRALVAPPRRSHRVQITDHGRMRRHDGHLWGRTRTVEPQGEGMVYDLVVAEDHSYVADGISHLGSAFMPDGSEV